MGVFVYKTWFHILGLDAGFVILGAHLLLVERKTDDKELHFVAFSRSMHEKRMRSLLVLF